MITSFKEIRVWQKAHQLVVEIYKITKGYPSEEKLGLISQMRRAAVSIPSNIVEGFRRNTAKVSRNFYDISNGSLEELKYQLLLSKDLGYISDDTYTKILALSEEISKMLRAWSDKQR